MDSAPPSDPTPGPRSVKVHRSLTRRSYFLGVGWAVLAAEVMLLWIPFAFFGLFSPITLGTALLVGLLTLGARWARATDQDAIEVFVREAATPSRFPAQPAVCDAPRRPAPSIPPGL